MRVMTIFGTRPEAIKMAPVVLALEREPRIESLVCVTGQHREMLEQALGVFGIEPKHDLSVMRPAQTLGDLTAAILTGLAPVLASARPDIVLVHGDTTTTLAASLAAFYARVPVGHVEAGLRTGDMSAPWPEEMNRRLSGALATWHFAPTSRAAENLRREGVRPEAICVTGNTVVDALLLARAKLEGDRGLCAAIERGLPIPEGDRRLILVTGHRRENFGPGFEQICRSLLAVSERDDVEIAYPVHLNPQVREPVERLLGARRRIHLMEPVGYLPFVRLMQLSHVILTDSGGVQEEAPSLGKPVLVMRETTERPEAVEAGTVQLVGTDPSAIIAAIDRLLDDPVVYASMANATNPYGDGHAAGRIVKRLLDACA